MPKQDLYIAGEGGTCTVVKIGKSIAPQKRLSELQTGYPRKLQLLHVEPEAGHLERWLHELFAGHRQEGEWFDFPTDPLAEIKAAIDRWRKETQHVHAGDSSYFAYVHLGCRHPDCQAAALEYRERLKARHASGEYKDRRYKANQEQPSAYDTLQQLLADPENAAKARALLGISELLPPETVDVKTLAREYAARNAARPGPYPSSHQVALPAAEAIPRDPEPVAQPLSPSPEGNGDPQESEAVTGDLSEAAAKVLKYLEVFCSIPGAKGKLNAVMLPQMPTLLQMSPERIQAALDELENAGLLAGDGTDLYLRDA